MCQWQKHNSVIKSKIIVKNITIKNTNCFILLDLNFFPPNFGKDVLIH